MTNSLQICPRQITEDKTEAILRNLVQNKGSWPTRKEIASVRGLQSAMARSGNAKFWKKRLGMFWDAERVETELCNLTKDTKLWPEQKEIDAIVGLQGAILKYGGPKHWRSRLDLERRPHPSKIWNEQTIKEKILEVSNGSPYWPTVNDFQKSGNFSFYTNVIRRSGGAEHWRKKMGMPLAPRKGTAGKTYLRWTQEKLLAELEDFTTCFLRWPTHQQFMQADKEYLYQAARKHGGIEYWMGELGFKNTEERGGRPKTSHQEYVERLHGLCKKFGEADRLPKAELIQREDSGLYAYMLRTGGLRQWKEQEGLLPHKVSRPRKWTKQRLEKDIAKMLGQIGIEKTGGYFPTRKFFNTKSRLRLYVALSKYGGIRFWAKEFDLPLSPMSERRARQTEDCYPIYST